MFFDNSCDMDLFGDILKQHKSEFDRGYLTNIFNFQKSIMVKIYFNVFDKLKNNLKNNDYMIVYNES